MTFILAVFVNFFTPTLLDSPGKGKRWKWDDKTYYQESPNGGYEEKKWSETESISGSIDGDAVVNIANSLSKTDCLILLGISVSICYLIYNYYNNYKSNSTSDVSDDSSNNNE